MRVYLDLCCLKRPFDDQTQPRIRAESEAVLAVITMGLKNVEFVQTPALHLENEQNPVFHRANLVRDWLYNQTEFIPQETLLTNRTTELMSVGFKNFDAFHLASAELAGVNKFVTCDDKLLSLARRHAGQIRVAVEDPLALASEVLS
jgi:hypothetical protein